MVDMAENNVFEDEVLPPGQGALEQVPPVTEAPLIPPPPPTVLQQAPLANERQVEEETDRIMNCTTRSERRNDVV
jgi:type IV secretory pathway VirB10-like protein